MAESEAKPAVEEEYVLFGDKKLSLEDAAKTVGYPNSAVWCRNIQEVMNVITHGKISNHVSTTGAAKIMEILVSQGRVDVVKRSDGTDSWNIHSNPDAQLHKKKKKKKKKKKTQSVSASVTIPS
jgi:hypothetical protein